MSGEPDVYGPDIPPETLLESLERLGWIDSSDKDEYSLTSLGAALLRSSEMADESSDVATSVVLGAGDELAYPRLMRRLSEAGPGALVDPYLRLEQLALITTHTEMCQFLISERIGRDALVGITVFVQSRSGAPVEVRAAKAGVLHDRLIIGRDFVDSIGTSLNTVGKQHPTVLYNTASSASSGGNAAPLHAVVGGCASTRRTSASHVWPR